MSSTSSSSGMSSTSGTSNDVVVVGAGIAGVACARALRDAGHPARLVDRGRRIGGRMASRRIDGRPVDLGASYFTVTDDGFAAVVDDWETRDLARPWTDTFTVLDAVPDGDAPVDKAGPMRWGAPGGLRSLVEDLAVGLDPEERSVSSVEVEDGLRVDGDPASVVVLAMPDPQAARLLGPGLDDVRVRLDRPSDAQIALVARWPERTWDAVSPSGTFHGAFVNGDDALSWIADDGRRRGDDAPCLVAHSTPELAARHLEDPEGARAPMLEALQRVLGIDPAGPPAETHVHRWSLAKPAGEREEPYLLQSAGAGLVGVCGDGWGPASKVEGAWLSGHRLGQELAARLR